MSDEISTDELFGDGPDKPDTAPEPPKAKSKRAVKPKAAARGGKNVTQVGENAPEQVLIDNAIAVRDIDWQCPCGNRNTHDLRMCGKCRERRYTYTD